MRKPKLFRVSDKVLERYDHFIVHCSATPPSADFDAADIDRMHRDRGWSGNGYHVIITRKGVIQARKLGHLCRPLSRSGAHVGDCGPGWNTRSLGVCLIGGVDDEGRPEQNYTKEQYAALEYVIQAFYKAHPKPWSLTIMGHRDLIKQQNAPPKACPCFDVKDHVRKYKILDKFDFQGDMEDIDNSGKGAVALPESHVVKAGDTYWSLSRRYGLPIDELKRINGFRANELRIGSEIKLR